ncbi:MAG: Holliday junction branch migration protein RuvA [Paludibacteraceae bacterium]|nr:Holliday junction branch migration protein RuvA [Paludibacteraceae bacterium]
MIDYVKGNITDLSPAVAVCEAGGVGYEVNIPLSVYAELSADKSRTAEPVRIYVHEVIREDAHLLFGFLTKQEREVFRLLITVSGIGPNTARLFLSSYSAYELQQLIATGNAKALSQVKGIGAKTAQRLVVDLKDKIMKLDIGPSGEIADITLPSGQTAEEAAAALTMLGFPAAASQKVVGQILCEQPSASVEQVIKLALKML